MVYDGRRAGIHVLSQIAMGLIHLTGDGVERDDDEAEEWFQMAAEQGDPLAIRMVEVLEGAGSEDEEGGG